MTNEVTMTKRDTDIYGDIIQVINRATILDVTDEGFICGRIYVDEMEDIIDALDNAGLCAHAHVDGRTMSLKTLYINEILINGNTLVVFDNSVIFVSHKDGGRAFTIRFSSIEKRWCLEANMISVEYTTYSIFTRPLDSTSLTVFDNDDVLEPIAIID